MGPRPRGALPQRPPGSAGPLPPLPRTRKLGAKGGLVDGAGVCRQSIDHRVLSILKAAGLSYAKPFHALWKNLATDWANLVPVQASAYWLGHSIEVSNRHYLPVTGDLYDRVTNLRQAR